MQLEIILGSLSLALGSLGAICASRIGWRLGFVDHPSARSSHSQDTPKGGGIGMAAAFLVTAIILGMPIAFWLPLGFLAGLSLCGDQVEISPKLRLSAQFILVGIMALATGRGMEQGLPGILVSLFWVIFIVGTANFYNFMDGIDGIAGISGVVGFGLLVLALHQDQPGIALLAACMALACLGFLPFNLPRARVFMGDVGSILLGSVFAGLVFLASRSLLDFLCMASFLFPFYADELTTVLIRLRAGENLTQPHRRHVYQLLANELRIPHWRISAAYGFFQLLVGGSVWLCKPLGAAPVLVVLTIWSGLFVWGSCYLRRKDF